MGLVLDPEWWPNDPPPAPEPSVVHVIDKFVEFVAKNGVGFENMTKEVWKGQGEKILDTDLLTL